MMPKSVKQFSGDIMLYLSVSEADSDFRSFDLKSSDSRRLSSCDATMIGDLTSSGICKVFDVRG